MSLVSGFTSVVAAMSMAVTQAASSPPTPAEKPQKEKLICKAYKVTGSRLGRSEICMTKSQWEFENDELNSDHRNRLGRENKIPSH